MPDVVSFPGFPDPSNTITGSVASGAILSGAYFNCDAFGVIDVMIDAGSVGVAPTVFVDHSQDGSTTFLTQQFGNAASLVNRYYVLSIPTLAPYYQLRVQNNHGGTETIVVDTLLRPPRESGHRGSIGMTPAASSAIAIPLGFAFFGDAITNQSAGVVLMGTATVTPDNPGVTTTAARVLVDGNGSLYTHQRVGVMEGRTVKQAFVDSAAGGNITLVAAVAAKSIWVVSYQFSMGNTATTLFLKDGAAGSQLTMSHRMAGNGSFVAPASPGLVYCKGSVNTALVVNASAANAISAQVEYIEF